MWQQRGSVLDQPAWVGREDLLQTETTVAGSRLGPYQIEEIIGAGGMGEVYRALDTRLGRTVAIKLIPHELTAEPTYRRRFLHEARAVSALNHPNIVILYDISHHQEMEFLVMEYVPGKSLKELIPQEGLPFERVRGLGLQVASALDAAHAAGIVHRDVKPANILVTGNDHVKVLDFGIAKLPVNCTATQLTLRGQVIGTLGYMSPEQTRGEEIDKRSDIFSLGCVLYEAATGRMPFRGPSALTVLHAIAVEDPPAPSSIRPELPAAFDALIARCLRKAPLERFTSMAEVRSALDQAGAQPASITLALAPIASIAILPFVTTGTDGDAEHLGEGLADQLIDALSIIPQLRVAPRSSTFSFRAKASRDKMPDAREIGRLLNTGCVLEGSIRRAGPRLRISMRLILVADGQALWSERFDRAIADVFEVQDEITAAVVAKLRSQLSGDLSELPPPALKRSTEDPEAYGLYLKGLYHWNKRPAGTYAAIDCFQKALLRDPKYALAHASLADCYNTLGSWEAGMLSPEEAYSKGRAYAERSLQLEPNLAEGHTALGYGQLHFEWNLRAAERSITEAIRLKPAYGAAHHWYSHLLIAARRFEESREHSLQYLAFDPTDPKAVSHLCWHHLMSHDFSTAEQECRAAVSQEPSFAWHHTYLGWALLASGRLDEAHREMEEGARCSGGLSVFRNFLTHARAIVGHLDLAAADLDRLREISQQQCVSPYETGLIQEALGNRAEAFRQWELAFAQRSPWLVYLASEPRLMHLNGDSQYTALLGRIQRVLQRASS
jgi:serine/threonine protein kinase/tetratricopeptide (TPR) repeat protein